MPAGLGKDSEKFPELVYRPTDLRTEDPAETGTFVMTLGSGRPPGNTSISVLVEDDKVRTQDPMYDLAGDRHKPNDSYSRCVLRHQNESTQALKGQGEP